MGENCGEPLAVILLALIEVCLSSAAVEVRPSINPAVAGGTLTLSPSPPTLLTSASWAVGGSLIITWVGGQQAPFPGYSGRASVNTSTGALTLSPVTTADAGVYILQSSDGQLRANTSIAVLEPVSNVTVRVNQTSLTELSSSAVITCSVSSGSSLSLLWLNGSSEVTAGAGAQLTDGNSTLVIVNVTRYDQGPFACYAFNPVSNGTSDGVNLTIVYGPDNMALAVNGQSATNFLVGSNLTLVCSAQSGPPAQLRWAFRGQTVNSTGPVLKLHNVTEDQSGPYSCVAFNSATAVNTSITAQLTIAEASGSNVRRLPLLLLVGSLVALPGEL